MALQSYNLDTLSALQDERPAAKNKYTLQIQLNINGDFKTKKYDPMPFSPNMIVSKDKYPSGRIYFAPIVENKMKDLISVAGDGNDYRKVLANRDQYTEMLRKALKDKDRPHMTRIDIERHTPAFDNVIKKNIELTQKLFFPSNGLIYILGKPYVIRSCVINWRTLSMKQLDDVQEDAEEDKNKLSSELETKAKVKRMHTPLPEIYQITFNLIVLSVAPDQVKDDKVSASLKGKSKTCYERSLEIDNQMTQLLKGTGLKLSSLFAKKAEDEAAAKGKEAALVKTASLNVLQTDWQGRNAPKMSELYVAETNRPAAAKQIGQIIAKLEALDELAAEIPSDYMSQIQSYFDDMRRLREDIAYLENILKTYTEAGTPLTVTETYYKQQIEQILNDKNTELKAKVNAFEEAHKKYNQVNVPAKDEKTKEDELTIQIKQLTDQLNATKNVTEKDAIAKKLDDLLIQQKELSKPTKDASGSDSEAAIQAKREIDTLRGMTGKEKYKTILQRIQTNEQELDQLKFARMFKAVTSGAIKKKYIKILRDLLEELRLLTRDIERQSDTTKRGQLQKDKQNKQNKYLDNIMLLKRELASASVAKKEDAMQILKSENLPEDEKALIKYLTTRTLSGGRHMKTRKFKRRKSRRKSRRFVRRRTHA